MAHSIQNFITPTDILPLSCSRSGTCCHGKMVWLNPWELACLAHEKGISARQMRDDYCEFGGIRLLFDGPPGKLGFKSCRVYKADFGCSLHGSRPLACRLFPLGRVRQSDVVRYMYQGDQFPCLAECPEVVGLPHRAVAEYLESQKIVLWEVAQNAYLELMQQLADGAFVLLLESGLAATGDRATLRSWRAVGALDPAGLVDFLGPEWIDQLTLPDLDESLDDPELFIHRHGTLLQARSQELFGALQTVESVSNASVVMMGLALHIGRSMGINPAELSTRWVATAKEHGALE